MSSTGPDRPGRDAVDLLAEHIRLHFSRHSSSAISHEATPEEVRDHLEAHYDFQEPLAADVVFEGATSMLWRWSEHATNPRHFGLTRPTVDLPSVVADALVALYDPNLATWNFSPAAVEIERHVLRFLGGFFGMGEDDHFASFTSGGEEANATAVAAALTQKLPAAGREGLRALPSQPTFYLSEEGHHSFDKVAHRSGLGRDALRWVPVDARLQMDVRALEARIRQDIEEGFSPFLVAATAGTINAGVIDPLDAIADVAEAYDLWLHVDGAWGAAAALSPTLRDALAGVERADSLTFDGHKWLSVPVGAGMFFTKHREAIERAFATSASYVPPMSGGREYYFVTSCQWSRRFIGLKVFMMLAERGIDAIVERIERQARLGDLLRDELRAAGWSILNRTRLPVICFTHPRVGSGGPSHAEIVEQLRRTQQAWISRVQLHDGTEGLRASITNYNSSPADVEALVAALGEAVSTPSGGLEVAGRLS